MDNYKYHYVFEKSIFSKKVTKKLWLMFGNRAGKSIREVYMAIRILHQRYATRDYKKFFYCTRKNISDIALIGKRFTGRYVMVLMKLGLIYRVINPKEKVIKENDGLTEVVKTFESRKDRKTSFIQVHLLSEEVLGIAISKAPEVSLWLKKKNAVENNAKTAKRLIKKLEKTMTKEEIKNSKTGLTQA